MRILYIDVDSLRPDHLGCYGYHRNTSPNIDSLARNAVIFTNCYASDVPCLPSRTALWRGQHGFRTGVVNHAGARAQPYNGGRDRWFRDDFFRYGWLSQLREAGIEHTATISSFGERHAAWHWYAGYHEVHNSGEMGMDIAEDIAAQAINWLQAKGKQDNWFLHVNFWDPHTPYRTPESFGNPFANDPLPAWLTEDVRQRAWDGFGPHSAQEPSGLGHETFHEMYPRVPEQLDSMHAVRRWIDGYDVGIRYMDEQIGHLLNTLADLDVLDDTMIMLSADHGENLGELNVWGDHQTADQHTCNIPLIVHVPGLTKNQRVDNALHYQFDWAATCIELMGGTVPEDWDGQSFASAFQNGTEQGREFLVLSQGAWACQRAVRFDDFLYIDTYHDGFKALEPTMLFDLSNDPHEQHDLASEAPSTVQQAQAYLTQWQRDMLQTSDTDIDPLMTVLREGGPYHVRDDLQTYVQRLRQTNRANHADRLLRRHSH